MCSNTGATLELRLCRHFSGNRRTRLLQIMLGAGLVSVGGLEVPTYIYAGGSRSAREKWMGEQRDFMSKEFQFSTYSKRGFSGRLSRRRCISTSEM